MEYKKVKTKTDKLKEQGLPINYCKIHCLMAKGITRIVEAVYKQTKLDHNADIYLTKRVKVLLGITDKKTKFIIKNIGYGVYES